MILRIIGISLLNLKLFVFFWCNEREQVQKELRRD